VHPRPTGARLAVGVGELRRIDTGDGNGETGRRDHGRVSTQRRFDFGRRRGNTVRLPAGSRHPDHRHEEQDRAHRDRDESAKDKALHSRRTAIDAASFRARDEPCGG
jgi:hypothetical protein